MRRQREANLKLQPEKCFFLQTEVTYLGRVISKDGVRPNPKKLEAVEKFSVPATPKFQESYYRRHIPQFAKIAKPLTSLLKKDFIWGEKAQEAFEILKKKLCEAPILQYPDFSREFVLTPSLEMT